MKKFFTVLLTLVLLLGLGACGGNDAPKLEGFHVGYGRVDISPEEGVLLGGYSNNDRFSEGVMDALYVTCVALTGEEGNTVLLITCDAIRADGAEQIR